MGSCGEGAHRTLVQDTAARLRVSRGRRSELPAESVGLAILTLFLRRPATACGEPKAGGAQRQVARPELSVGQPVSSAKTSDEKLPSTGVCPSLNQGVPFP